MAIYKDKNFRIRVMSFDGCETSPDSEYPWEYNGFLFRKISMREVIDGKSETFTLTYGQYVELHERSHSWHYPVFYCEHRGHRGWTFEAALPIDVNITYLIKDLYYVTRAEQRHIMRSFINKNCFLKVSDGFINFEKEHVRRIYPNINLVNWREKIVMKDVLILQ